LSTAQVLAAELISPGVFEFDGNVPEGFLTNDDVSKVGPIASRGQAVNDIASPVLAMRDGLIYDNVHSEAFPAGKLRGQLFGN